MIDLDVQESQGRGGSISINSLSASIATIPVPNERPASHSRLSWTRSGFPMGHLLGLLLLPAPPHSLTAHSSSSSRATANKITVRGSKDASGSHTSGSAHRSASSPRPHPPSIPSFPLLHRIGRALSIHLPLPPTGNGLERARIMFPKSFSVHPSIGPPSGLSHDHSKRAVLDPADEQVFSQGGRTTTRPLRQG